MDPNETLEKLLEKAKEILAALDHKPYDADVRYEASELAERITDLDAWIRKGGFLPAAWRPNEVVAIAAADVRRGQMVVAAGDRTNREFGIALLGALTDNYVLDPGFTKEGAVKLVDEVLEEMKGEWLQESWDRELAALETNRDERNVPMSWRTERAQLIELGRLWRKAERTGTGMEKRFRRPTKASGAPPERHHLLFTYFHDTQGQPIDFAKATKPQKEKTP